jgi:hypothetical protein
MTPRRRFAALLTVLAFLVLAVQSAGASIDPTVDMSPASPYTFANTAVGSSATKTVTVSNPGPDDEVFSGAPTLAGANPGQFSIANNTCTGTVASGTGCSFDVTFAPTAAAAASAAVQFAASPAIADYQVSGTGTPGGSISVDATSLDFGGVKLGTSSAKTVTVRNTGSDNVTLGSIVASQSQYTVSGGCGGTVLAKNGGSCAITVTFTPTTAGALSADLTIPYTGASDVSKVVSLTGTGTQPLLTFTPSTGLTYSIGIGDTTAPQTLSIKNNGDATMNISGITIAGTDAARFAISSKTCGATLAAGATCTVSVTFTPNAAGVFNATVHVADDALDNPHDANLTGTATVPGVQTTPTSLTFASQQDGTLGTTMQVAVKNTSTSASLKVGTLTIGGTNKGSFIFAANGDTCSGKTVAPGATCTVKITFRPQLIGPKSAALQIPSNADATANVALLGTSLAPPAVKGVHGSSGCTKANIGWTTPTPPRYVKVLIVRSRDHVPETPTDGTVLTHGTGALNDTGLQVTSTYHYSLFTVTNAYDNPERLIYAKPTSINLVAGRVCTPMNGAKITDLTPLIDWVTATGGSSTYSVRLVTSGGATILVRYTGASTTKYQIQSQWQYNGSSHRLVKGQTYTAYVYEYNNKYPVGRWIGQSKWAQG